MQLQSPFSWRWVNTSRSKYVEPILYEIGYHHYIILIVIMCLSMSYPAFPTFVRTNTLPSTGLLSSGSTTK